MVAVARMKAHGVPTTAEVAAENLWKSSFMYLPSRERRILPLCADLGRCERRTRRVYGSRYATWHSACQRAASRPTQARMTSLLLQAWLGRHQLTASAPVACSLVWPCARGSSFGHRPRPGHMLRHRRRAEIDDG